MPRYRLTIITNPQSAPAKLLEIVTKTSQVVQESGGVVLNVRNQGVQPLAYAYEDR